jgi:hypothetical protein
VLSLGERFSLFPYEEPDAYRLSMQMQRYGGKGLPTKASGQDPLGGAWVLL